ncbi:MAG: excinuclease ABC subunit UvrA [Proteobacteria bacterium]|nr:excinuclease ABC subunit UvrA [Desulfobacteraceae bacterium]MBU3981597.1 excinuclease ABC subunit UvrA [Pseudomonadota bacterium]MBU4013295.1 excinuclease ABC subunit UvrA [Pseudomonadota bacterium]MBU4068801.1 excinuclease ABC subunit UvrA [Pseudomonadota bacterium]MBU4099923.1 excinuclease ABC subunit UvrA [Pseudomonadota bacterium]
MKSEKIIIHGARQHNLKNIDVELPRNKLVVITGLSGSGKSTLAFDTLYAEGQRRYVESLSTYARQFLERLDKPDVDMIDGLSPAIAIEQKTASHNPRSTVGTVTEIYDYLRLLFARTGTPHCYKCGKPITSQTLDQIVDKVMSMPEGTRITILSPLIAGQKGTHEKLLKHLKRDGFARIRINGKTFEIEDIDKLDKNKKHTIDVVVDRLVVKENIKNRLADSLELAVSQSGGIAMVDVSDKKPVLFSEKAACITCGISYPEFTPASFSFNSPQGACPKCDGLGSTNVFDSDQIIPNPELSLREGAVILWANRNSVHFFEFLDALTMHYGVDIYTPYKDLPDNFKNVLLYGSGDEQISFYIERNNRRFNYRKPFEGIIPKLERRYLETDSYRAREEIKYYMSFRPCPECQGTRLNKGSRSVKVGGLTMSEITAFTVTKAYAFLKKLELSGKKKIIAKRILKEIIERLGFLDNVGLSYLTLARSACTLSGGESQRIRLATQIGSKLTGVLYVLDEPSIGLHQRDNQRLIGTLLQMRDYGNTILVVEHDKETILSSDYVIDMGPGAGINGGQVVFSGTPKELLKDKDSLTGQYFSGRKKIEVPAKRRKVQGKEIVIKGASENNLKNIDVGFPLGCFICITGVSGSGKSTLVLETLYRSLAQRIYHSRIPSGKLKDIVGLEQIDKVVNIDQSPIGRTPRSNPGTYTGVFTFIRELFSKTVEARMRGYKLGRFSFNVKGGRCEACNGDGIIKIEMHFLPDVYVACDVCHGKRYNRETLEVRYKGKNIADVLDMTINQSVKFFENMTNIRSKLQTLVEVGIGYIHLGQPATTLSGGEAQRIKLSRELSKKGTGKTIYILDEPTTGLHIDDIKKLLNVLNRLVDAGNTVIVIEHNMDVIKSADHIIDLGPEGGDKGGKVIGCGTPEEIAEIDGSYTGQYLKKFLL